jgi:hypothetical protein
MRKLLIVLVIVLMGCNKDVIITPTYNQSIPEVKQNPVITKTGFFINTDWFSRNYPGYTNQTNRWYGYGDFNKDGLRDIVCAFASNGTQDYLWQNDTTKRLVVGVFLNNKTYFELDTNLVYSYLGGWNGANVSDIDNDGYLDIYQMTGYWEGSTKQKPAYYNNSGHGGMDSYVFMNNKNKSFKRYTIPVKDNAGSTTSIISDNNKNGYKEIYSSSCMCYYEFDGNGINEIPLTLNKTFEGKQYDLRVITPKYQSEKYGVFYLASHNFTNTYFVLKVINNTLTPIVKYETPIQESGFTEGTNSEREEMYVEDLDADGSPEYVIPSQTFSNETKWCTPYLLFLDSKGNDVTSKFLDKSITNPLTYDQFNAGIKNITGFIYHTFADIDNDGIKEIFSASGLGYKMKGDTYYFKLINGKYTTVFYHTGWYGDVNTTDKNTNYWPFVDEKNKVNVFTATERTTNHFIIKTF